MRGVFCCLRTRLSPGRAVRPGTRVMALPGAAEKRISHRPVENPVWISNWFSRSLPFTAAVLVLLSAVQAVPAFGEDPPHVRLLLEEKVTGSVVTGPSLQVQKRVRHSWEPVLEGRTTATFQIRGGEIGLEGTELTASAYRIKSARGFLAYGGQPLRGYLTITGSREGLTVVSHMPLESYLEGVVNGEIDSSWPMEAVKAQVVAARSYALFRMQGEGTLYDLKTDVSDQVYAGLRSEDPRAGEAVRLTRGQVLTSNGSPIEAFYHASCGGRTSSALEVWGIVQPSLSGVVCGACDDAPHARWNLSLDRGRITEAIRILYPRVRSPRSLGIHRRTTDGRVLTLYVETAEGRVLVDAGDFRKVLGYRQLPSTRFSLGMAGETIVLTGEGYGHGVGLCQWGARGSALAGMDYRQILGKYYPGAEVRRIY